LSWRKARLEIGLSGGVIRQVSDAVPAARRTHSPEHDTFAALNAFHGLIREAAKAPLFLAVDDVHLADTWSKRCLAYARPPIAIAFLRGKLAAIGNDLGMVA
jgi:hypothetical protein